MNPFDNIGLPYQYQVASSALANAASGTFTLQFDNSTDFEWHEIGGSCTEDADTDFMPNNFSCQITNQSSGFYFSTDRVPARIGFPYQGKRLLKPVIIRASTVLRFDILNLTANSNTVTITLTGFRYPSGTLR